MSLHRDQDNEPQLVFSRDPRSNEFRETISGWFLRGHPLTISYDPTRIVPPSDDYRFGDSTRPIVAHVQFREDGPVADIRLESWIGTPVELVVTTAYLAPKLKGVIDIPTDADWVTVWISYHRPDGQTLYDSSYGRNFRFRFYHDEITILQSDILHDGGTPLGKLAVRVATDVTVDRVVLRYRVLTDPLAPQPTHVDLTRSGQVDAQDRPVWETHEVLVPADRVIAYDLVYFSQGRPFKDDNQAKYFLAMATEKRLAAAV